MTTKKASRPFYETQPLKTFNPKDKSKDGIEKLIEIFDNRVSKMVQHSLKRFMTTYQEHPAFNEEEIPFIHADIKRAEKATDDLEKIVFVLGAGTSKTAGLPMASEIIKYCELALGEKLLTDEVELIRQSNSNKNKELD
ncbi:MAG TPA: hypothetical protein VK469_08155, partial [Candidatus Kapabacteria bacterium]|nr:hypothetical protein [Candidatus Kapabacteria bacterium]